MKRFHFSALKVFVFAMAIVAVLWSQHVTATLPPPEPCNPAPAGCIPGGATVVSATLSIYATNTSNQTVRVHAVTSAWAENGVTWDNFGESYNPAVVGSFLVSAAGWRTVDVTELVQGWVEGASANHGLLLKQEITGPYTTYRSSEYANPYPCLRPKLEICYVTPAAGETCVTIQRPGSAQDTVADAYIWASSPNANSGASTTLYTGLVGSGEKQTLIRFDICTLPCTGSIGDFVWHDQNRNGIQDTGEPGIENVNVTLTDETGATATTTTGPNGYYQFTGLCAGMYTVDVDEATLPPGFEASPYDASGSTTENDSNVSPEVVTLLTDDASDQTIDFGFLSPCTGQVGDLIWNDLNRNGIQDAGEPGLDGVTVNLKDGFDAIVFSTTSAPNGYYQFTGLCAGTYTVEVDTTTLPAGFVPSVCNGGADDAVDNDCSPASVSLESDNESVQTIDFGFFVPAVLGTGTPGYWMNHPDGWPVDTITIGGVSFTKSQAIFLMKQPTAKDKTYSMFQALVASKLNVMVGNDASCISDTIAAADDWMASHPAGSGVRAGGASSLWRLGEPLYKMLDDYNNGLLCGTSRDALE